MSSSRQSTPQTTIVIPTLFVVHDVIAYFLVIPYLVVYMASSVQIAYKFAFTLAFLCAICVGVLGNAIPMKTEKVRRGAFALSIPATRGGMLAARVIFIVACVLGVVISVTWFIYVMRDEQARRDEPIDHDNDGDENDEAVNEPIDNVFFTHGKISLVTAVGFIVYTLMYLIGTVISHLLREHTRFFKNAALPTILMKLPPA